MVDLGVVAVEGEALQALAALYQVRAGGETVDLVQGRRGENLVHVDIDVEVPFLGRIQRQAVALLARAQGVLGKLRLGDVGERSSHAQRRAVRVLVDLGARPYPAHFARLGHDAVFPLVPALCDAVVYVLVPAHDVIRVLWREGHDGSARPRQRAVRQHEHLTSPLGEEHLVRDDVPVPMAGVGALHCVRVALLARQQIAVREHAGQRVFQAPGDLLEEPALRGGPGSRMRTLVQPEQVGPVPLGTNRNRDDRLDAEPLAYFRRDAQIRRRPWALQHAPQELCLLHVHGELFAEREGAGIFGTRVLHHHARRGRIGIARIRQPGAIRAENGQRLLEHAAHHAFHVVRALHGAVDPVHALEEPQVLAALLLGPLLLRDVHDGADVLEDPAGAGKDWMRQATDSARPAGKVDQSIFSVPLATFAQRLFQLRHDPWHILRMYVREYPLERRQALRRVPTVDPKALLRPVKDLPRHGVPCEAAPVT